MTGAITERLATHAASATPTPDASAYLRLLAADYLAIARAGSTTPSALAARRAVSGERGSAWIEGVDAAVSAEAAALVNGIASHGLELDDTHEPSSSHPGVVVWPAVLALADGEGATLQELLDAASAGYDVMTAAGELLGAAESYGRGFHPTAVVGALGAAAAASRLLRFDIATTRHAIALGADMAAGSLEFLADGSWTKRLNAGHAAAVGIRAARLAGAGFQAPLSALEGANGWLRLYGEGLIDGRSLDLAPGAGALATSVKFFACCRYMHGVMDLLVDLHADGEVPDLDAVAVVEVAVIEAGQKLVSLPPERKLRVSSTVDAQFNMPFGAALALANGRARLGDFENAVALADELAPWMAKVVSVTTPRVEAAYPSTWSAEVTLRRTDGSTIQRRTSAFRGSPGARATWSDLQGKASELIGDAATAQLVETFRGAAGSASWRSIRASVTSPTPVDSASVGSA